MGRRRVADQDDCEPTSNELPQFELAEFVKRVLAEDLGSGGDVTSRATIDASARFVATMSGREDMVVAGLDIALAFFCAMDRDVPMATRWPRER